MEHRRVDTYHNSRWVTLGCRQSYASSGSAEKGWRGDPSVSQDGIAPGWKQYN